MEPGFGRDSERFAATLDSRRPAPLQLERLGHLVSPAAPGGLVTGLARPVARRCDGPELELRRRPQERREGRPWSWLQRLHSAPASAERERQLAHAQQAEALA